MNDSDASSSASMAPGRRLAARRRWLPRALLGAVVAFSSMTVSGQPANGAGPNIDGTARLRVDAPGRRIRHDLPELRGPIQRIAIVGDSMYFEGVDPNSRDNTIIRSIRQGLRSGLADPTIRVDNRSRPGLAIKFALTRPDGNDFVALHEWITETYPPNGDHPDLVVLPATSIDLNIEQDTDARVLAPQLVAELERVVAYLDSIGVQSVVVPVFGVNDALFDGLKSVVLGQAVTCNLNSRVKIVNDALAQSDLPMLFTAFQGMDLDGDGDVDEENFLGFHAERFPDDGIHTNATGEALIARQIAARLVRALAPTR